MGECRVRIGARLSRAGAGVAVAVRKVREGGVAMDAAVHEGLETLLGDEVRQRPGEGVGGGGGELEAEHAEHQDHDAVAMVGAERTVGLTCSRTEWGEVEVRAEVLELGLGVRLGSGSEGSSRWALLSR